MSQNEHSAVHDRDGSDPKRQDRRIARTRDALHRALISLVLEHGYEAVTIKDIVDRANVGRSTFYAHYQSKEDLLTAGMTDLRAMLIEHQRAAWARDGGVDERGLGFSFALFDHAESYRDVFRALIGERGAIIVINRMRALLTDLVRRDLAELAPGNVGGPVPHSALVQFIVGALMSILTWWLERSPPLPAQDADTIFRRLTVPALATLEPSSKNTALD